ncbi:MAG: carboxymuconolactone decarboxylase family protein [Pedobacter sp.]
MENILTPKQQGIVAAAAFTAKGDQFGLKAALGRGLDAGLTISELTEVLVQLYAYSGFPRSLNAINTFMTVLDERRANGITDPAGVEPTDAPGNGDKYQRGKETLEKLTGVKETQLKGANAFAPALDKFLKEHLFADIFDRNNLDYQTREIATIAALASLNGAEAQLGSHLSVGKNIGLSQAQLRSIAVTLGAKVGNKEALAIHSALDKMYNVITPLPKLSENTASIINQGTAGAKENFTGTVFTNIPVSSKDGYETTLGKVTFSPKARTNWHIHPTGQILVVTSGTGYYQEKGKPVQVIREGDLVKIPFNTEHWHGASHDSEMVHLAIVPGKPETGTFWLKPVNDAEYDLALE